MAHVEFPENLFESIRSQRCVLCTGVRFAAAAGYPDWDALLAKMKEKQGGDDPELKELVEQGKKLTVLGHVKRKLGTEAQAALLEELYGAEQELSPAHQAIAEIPFAGAITTGYDGLLEQVLGNGETPARVYTYADGSVLRLSDKLKHFVVKAHGAPGNKATPVLSRRDYRRLVAPNQAYRAFLENLYRTQPMLMVGFDLTDPDFQLLVERLMGGFREPVVDHFALLPGVTEVEAEELYANFRLRVVSYEAGDDPGAALAEALEALRDQWKERGEALPGPDDPAQQAAWLTQQLGAVDVRLDVMAAEGLQLSEGQLKAMAKAAEGVELDALEAEPLCRLGNVRIFLEDVPGAVECYEAALVKDEALAEAHLNLHHARAEAREFDEALEHLNQALELDPTLRTIPERYEIVKVIGRGTTGTIYEAKDSEEDRMVTVKVLRASYVREHLSPETWLEETEQLKTLEHEHIARVYDALLEGGRCILVAEALSGESLSRRLREKGSLAPDEAARILGQVCEALQYAHEQEVLHLDITPSNIFIREGGSVALMDFRSARAAKGRSVTVKRGSEGFQAPELLARAGADARADIYSLGAVLYHALTGKLALGSFLPVGELVPAARRYDSLIARSLRPLPDDRPQKVEQFAKALAGGAEEVSLPEQEDDLEGWLEVLTLQPENARAHEALDKMERTFRADQDWEKMILLLLSKAEVETESEARVKQLRELAQIFEREVGDLGNAFTTLAEAFREDPNNLEIRKDLERLAQATGMWNELLQEYNNLVQKLRDPKVSADWLVRMGRLYANELGYDDYAVASFQQALNLDKNRTDALAELAEVLQRKGDHKELAKTLSRQAELEEDLVRKLEVYKALAQIYLKELSSDEEAILTYRKMLELDPANAVAVAALKGLYHKQEMWDELVLLLESRIEEIEVAADQASLRHDLAEVLAEKLERPDDAIVHYQTLVEANPDDHKALRGLEKLLEAAGRNEEYLAILDKRIAAAATDEERVELCRRMAAQWEEQEGGAARAAEYMEKVVAINEGDEAAYKTLVRLYWAASDHEKLAETYRKHIAVAKKAEDKVPLYAGLGMVYEEHLEDLEQAVETFHNLLAVEEKNKLALSGLARLYEKQEAWKQAIGMLEKLAAQEESVDAQADLFCNIGMLQYQKMKKVDEAEINLVKALELKEDHLGAMSALAHLYRERKDFGKAARMLLEAARHTANELERVERLHQAAKTYLQDLEDEDKALEVFEELLEIDPEHVASGELVAPIYEKRGNTDRAETVLEMLVRKADTKDRPRAIELNLRLGEVALKNDNQDRALTAYRGAYDLDPTNQTSLKRLADILYQREEVAEAAKLFQALLVHRRDSMEPADAVDVFYKLGTLKERQGEANKALNMFEKALDIDAKSKPVLEAAVTLYEGKGDLEAALRCRKTLLELAEDDEQKMELAEALGDLLVDKMRRPGEAVEFYRKVTEIKPDHRRVLNKIMEIFIEQQKWEDAIKAMGKIEDYEMEPLHRSRLHYTAGVIFRDELDRPQDAAHHFDQALMKDPTFRKAFDALKKLYTTQGNFKALANAYQVMLERLPKDTPVAEQAALWKELGELYRDKLQDTAEAIKAFEKADSLALTDAELKGALAELYVAAGPDAADKAVKANQELLRLDPQNLSAYRELQRLYGELKQADKAWCVTAVLAALGQGAKADVAAYEKHRQKTPRRVGRQVSDELWTTYLNHRFQSPLLSQVFAALAPVVAPMVARGESSFSLRASERLNLANDPRPYGKAVEYARQVVGRSPAEFYLQGALSEPLSMALVGDEREQRSVLRLSPRVIKTESQTELTYWLVKSFTLLRPEFQLAYMVASPEVLRALALAALKLVHPGLRLSGDVTEIDKLTAVLQRQLPPGSLDFLASAADRLRSCCTELALENWLVGVEYTASRAGMLLCDDLETAAKLLTTESDVRGKGVKERLAELLAFAVSERYFKLRELLGLSLNAG